MSYFVSFNQLSWNSGIELHFSAGRRRCSRRSRRRCSRRRSHHCNSCRRRLNLHHNANCYQY